VPNGKDARSYGGSPTPMNLGFVKAPMEARNMGSVPFLPNMRVGV